MRAKCEGPGKGNHVMSGFIDALYDRAASFGRDVLIYVVAGGVFVFVSGVPFWHVVRGFQGPANEILKSLAAMFGGGSIFVAIFTATVALLFALGHVMLSIGFCLSRELETCPGFVDRHLRSAKAAARRESQKYMTKHKLGGNTPGLKGLVKRRDEHLMLEIVALTRNKDLHGYFIERYNTLWHVRLALAAAFISAAVVAGATCFAFAALDTTSSPQPSGQLSVAVMASLMSFVFGAVLMRQQVRTRTNFYRRVLLVYAEASRDQQSKPEP